MNNHWVTMSSSSHCIFCVLQCPTVIKSEPDSILPDDLPPHSTFMKEEDSLILTEQLKVFFILRNILGIENDKLAQFLGRLEGTLPPQSWFKVCESCEEAVIRFYTISKEISRLEQEQIQIGNELKARINTTRDSSMEEDGDSNPTVWKEVREHVLEEFPADDPSLFFRADDFNGQIPNEEDNLVEEVFPFDVKYQPPNYEENLHNEQPSSQQEKKSTSKQRKKKPVHRYPLQGLPLSQAPRYSQTHRKKYTVYTCLECSCYLSCSRVLKPHMELHRPGSNAVTCESCGWLLDPKKVRYHMLYHHAEKASTRTPRAFIKCGDCGAFCTRPGKMKEHKVLHEEGGGVVCPIPTCGWLCKSLTSHNTQWHPQGKDEAVMIKKRMAGRRIVTD